MKKFNAKKITEILNDRFAAGISHTPGMRAHFSIDGNDVALFDFDRGDRHDHGGGPNGDDWMDSGQIDAQYKHFENQYRQTINLIKLTLKNKKYNCLVGLDIGEKGHVSLLIRASKKAVKKAAAVKGLGVIATIRQAIKYQRLTKDEILEILVFNFPDRDADKMAKTMAAQLGNRICKGHELVMDKNDRGYKLNKK